VKVNTTQKINAVWFLVIACIDLFLKKDVQYCVLTLTAFLCWHVIFSDNIKKEK